MRKRVTEAQIPQIIWDAKGKRSRPEVQLRAGCRERIMQSTGEAASYYRFLCGLRTFRRVLCFAERAPSNMQGVDEVRGVSPRQSVESKSRC